MNRTKTGKILCISLFNALFLTMVALAGCTGQQGASSTPKESSSSGKEEAAAPAKSGPQGNLVIIGYVAGTSMDMRAKALGEVLTKYGRYNVTVQDTSGIAGLIDFHEGRADGYLSLQPKKVNDQVMDLYVPDVPKEKRRAEAVIVPTAVKTLQLVVREELPFDSLMEWREKKAPVRAGVGQRGNKLVMDAVLGAYGITMDDIRNWGGVVDDKTSGGKSHDLIRDGKLDTRFAYGGVPEPATEELSSAVPVKILPVGETEVIRQKIHDSTEMVTRVIPAKTYSFQDKDITSMGFPEFLLVRADLEEQVAYDMAKAIWDNVDYLTAVYEGFKEVLTSEEAIPLMQSQSIPIHPGAAKYYREKGWLK